MCTIAANIWGTRFKFYGHSNHLPEYLGSVTYKTSFLHLQPRQMTVTVADNSNNGNKKSISDSRRQSKRTIINDRRTSLSCRLQRKSTATTATISHRDASPPHSSSPSPMNRSRSTSPAASIANFIHPISPPCIQMKEPLSPKFSRASSTITNHDRQCSAIYCE